MQSPTLGLHTPTTCVSGSCQLALLYELELTPEVEDALARERYPEIDMLNEMIQDELFFTGRVSIRDVKKVARIKEAMYRDWIKLHNRQTRAAVRDTKNATRYLKRSSNQLIKSLKALGNA